MDLVFDIDLSAGPVSKPAPDDPRSHRTGASVTAVARWYDWGYAALPGQLGAGSAAFLAADTTELLAYCWVTADAAEGRPRQDIV
jgi:hypothetical protein